MKVNGKQAARLRMPDHAIKASREARVEAIALRVKQGAYVWPTSQQIAEKIVDDALLTARLQARFEGWPR
jgi:anti-sigma28 factor (negative regulator of flagellin synthesis)